MAGRFNTILIGTGVSSIIMGVITQGALQTKSWTWVFILFPFVMVFSYFVVPLYIHRWATRSSAGLFVTHAENSRDGLFGQAQSLLVAKKYEEAVVVFQRLLSRYPHDVVTYRIMLDVVCHELGDPARAEQLFKGSLRRVKDKQVQQKLFMVFREATREKSVELEGL